LISYLLLNPVLWSPCPSRLGLSPCCKMSLSSSTVYKTVIAPKMSHWVLCPARGTTRPAGAPAGRSSGLIPVTQVLGRSPSWRGAKNAAISMVVRIFGLWSNTSTAVDQRLS
jgi:hypothetical protein